MALVYKNSSAQKQNEIKYKDAIRDYIFSINYLLKTTWKINIRTNIRKNINNYITCFWECMSVFLRKLLPPLFPLTFTSFKIKVSYNV